MSSIKKNKKQSSALMLWAFLCGGVSGDPIPPEMSFSIKNSIESQDWSLLTQAPLSFTIPKEFSQQKPHEKANEGHLTFTEAYKALIEGENEKAYTYFKAISEAHIFESVYDSADAYLRENLSYVYVNLAYFYEHGVGIEKNLEQARILAARSARLGLPQGM